MGTININDTIYATAQYRGSVAACVTMSGIQSPVEVLGALKREMGGVSGLLRITMRNMTQGWCSQKAVYLR